MKKLITVAAFLVATMGAYAQGTVSFGNLNSQAGINAPVFDADGVTKLNNTFMAQLYAGPVGGSLAAIGSPVAFTGSGYVLGPALAIPTVAPGVNANGIVKAWNASAGATFEAASLVAGAHRGQSALLTFATGGVGIPPSTPGSLTGLTSFNLGIVPAVPEPTTLALGLLGAGALLLRRRK
ncbi:MAG: PEP-CTERM sorting domain-containing protein [Limisphaerales bacterium]